MRRKTGGARRRAQMSRRDFRAQAAATTAVDVKKLTFTLTQCSDAKACRFIGGSSCNSNKSQSVLKRTQALTDFVTLTSRCSMSTPDVGVETLDAARESLGRFLRQCERE